ncbi:MAG: 4-hydroxy-tetrahydrodipicolinate synthase [Helicobacteraceae bacterium]|jgi:4-hydroxy-tetrahydrodipicolinate synthase|nr:4-hydroxy-tetrahydrodipicolinate synthase [Helicobacteraceae bacterium]
MFSGLITALITPFKNGKIDFDRYEKLIKRQIALGASGVVPVGTTGESPTLSHAEHKECVEAAIAVCKRGGTKVVAGAGSNSTLEAIDLARFAQKAGADAILCIAPYYNKPTQEGLYRHYKAIAEAVEIPIILYNVPSRTGSDILPQTVFRLADEAKNIVGIKEATGSMERAVAIGAIRPDFAVISGEDAINYPIVANGGRGAISVTGNLLPDLVSDCIQSTLKGDYGRGKRLSDLLYPINKALFLESNPIPIKAAMFLSGLIETPEYRLPLVEPSAETIAQLEKTLKNYEVKGF